MSADFRSDTYTQPTDAMRQAMATALVGDDVFGEDPTVKDLEVQAAKYLGQEASLFVASGTMANQVAVHVHCRPGDELICEARSHVYLYEGGSVARLSGTQVRCLERDSGFLSVEDLQALVRADDPHFPRPRLLVIENTHNLAGGKVLDKAGMAQLISTAHDMGLMVHVDGARISNAAVACGSPAAELVAGADSVSLCFSKGLGAPVGSVIAGTAGFIAQARRARKAFGGGMRQVGVLAAAAQLALRDGPALLTVDHQRAQTMAATFANLPGLKVDLQAVHSNILMVGMVNRNPGDLVSYLGDKGVLALAADPTRVRFVLHRDLTDADVELCIATVREWAFSQ